MLIVRKQLARHVFCALEAIADRMMAIEVLPAIDMLCLEGQSVASIVRFIAAHQDFDRPVIIVDTDTEFEERLYSLTYRR